MAWIFFQASEESATHSENIAPQNITAKSTHIVKQCFSHEWQVETSTTHPSGTISKPFSQENSEPSTSLSAASRNHARISVLQDMEKAWQESEADYFSRSYAWPKKSSPVSYSLKTQTLSLQGEDQKSSKRLPISGLTVDGSLRKLERKVLHKYGKDGFVWPTPTASQASKPIREPSPSRKKGEHGYDLQDKIGEIHPNLIGKRINPQFLEWMMSYPLGWTELEPWAIQFVLNKREKPSKN